MTSLQTRVHTRLWIWYGFLATCDLQDGRSIEHFRWWLMMWWRSPRDGPCPDPGPATPSPFQKHVYKDHHERTAKSKNPPRAPTIIFHRFFFIVFCQIRSIDFLLLPLDSDNPNRNPFQLSLNRNPHPVRVSKHYEMSSRRPSKFNGGLTFLSPQKRNNSSWKTNNIGEIFCYLMVKWPDRLLGLGFPIMVMRYGSDDDDPCFLVIDFALFLLISVHLV